MCRSFTMTLSFWGKSRCCLESRRSEAFAPHISISHLILVICLAVCWWVLLAWESYITTKKLKPFPYLVPSSCFSDMGQDISYKGHGSWKCIWSEVQLTWLLLLQLLRFWCLLSDGRSQFCKELSSEWQCALLRQLQSTRDCEPMRFMILPSDE